MPIYLTPGVYVEEVQTGSNLIMGVGTSTAAFVGVAPTGDAHLNEAFACNNWTQFLKEFVGEGSRSTDLAQAVYGFFNNGGGRCYVINIGPNGQITGDPRKGTGLAGLEVIDEVAIVAAPGYSDPASYDALLSHCERLQDRFAILDSPKDVENIDALKQVGTPAPSGAAGDKEEPAKGAGKQVKACGPRKSNYGACYYPWLLCRDALGTGVDLYVPPSGHVAGIYARNDATRGVHKAPANENVRGALGLKDQVTHEAQGELNKAGVNCIRFFSDGGIRVWGARTCADKAQWLYVNVRRLFIFIEESIAEGTRWTVFEPNDERLWKSVVRDCTAFLKVIWRDGALKGTTPQEAFFVKCDAETNPPEVVDAGRLVIQIGIAPVKPAEFIIFQIGQWAGGVEVQS